MTRDELIAELSKYPPDTEVRLETCHDSPGIESVVPYSNDNRYIKIRGIGWDDLPEDDDEDEDEEEYDDEEYDSFDDEDEEDDGE